MKTLSGHVIDNESCRYKFGRDKMAEYLWMLSLDDGDRTVGGSDFGLWATRFGRRLVLSDGQGFVWAVKHNTAEEAKAHEEEIELAWLDYHNDVTCRQCGTHFDSEEGCCWCCGAEDYEEREQ